MCLGWTKCAACMCLCFSRATAQCYQKCTTARPCLMMCLQAVVEFSSWAFKTVEERRQCAYAQACVEVELGAAQRMSMVGTPCLKAELQLNGPLHLISPIQLKHIFFVFLPCKSVSLFPLANLCHPSSANLCPPVTSFPLAKHTGTRSGRILKHCKDVSIICRNRI